MSKKKRPREPLVQNQGRADPPARQPFPEAVPHPTSQTVPGTVERPTPLRQSPETRRDILVNAARQDRGGIEVRDMDRIKEKVTIRLETFQIVLLCLALLVVLALVFLAGVMVGQGCRQQRGSEGQIALLASSEPGTPRIPDFRSRHHDDDPSESEQPRRPNAVSGSIAPLRTRDAAPPIPAAARIPPPDARAAERPLLATTARRGLADVTALMPPPGARGADRTARPLLARRGLADVTALLPPPDSREADRAVRAAFARRGLADVMALLPLPEARGGNSTSTRFVARRGLDESAPRGGDDAPLWPAFAFSDPEACRSCAEPDGDCPVAVATPPVLIASLPTPPAPVPAPPAAAKPARTAPAAHDRNPVQRDPRYAVQVRSYREEDKAREFMEHLRARGLSPRVVRYDGAGGETWYRVRVGSFTGPSAAADFARTFNDSEGEHAIPVQVQQ